jgi:hypothetical protein
LNQERKVRTELLRIDAFRDTLLKAYEMGTEKTESSTRLIVLFTSLLKLREQSRAAQLLASEHFVEEIFSIGRTMAEVAVNAAYLQDADDEEIARFQYFDTQSLYKHVGKPRPHISTLLNAEQIQKIDHAVAFARSATNKKDNESSWSSRTLLQRGEYSDQKTKESLMANLVLTVYAAGHHYVHGSSSSLQPFFKALGTTTVPVTNQRLEELAQSLFGVNFVLHVSVSVRATASVKRVSAVMDCCHERRGCICSSS